MPNPDARDAFIVAPLYHTAYYGPTNTKGSRIKVTRWVEDELIVSWLPYDGASFDPHMQAVLDILNDAPKGYHTTRYPNVLPDDLIRLDRTLDDKGWIWAQRVRP